MEKETSYLGAMLTSQANLYAGLGAASLAVAASFPFGLVGAALPLLAFGVLEVLACLVVPDLPSFRAKVDTENRRARRAEVRNTLLGELSRRIPVGINGSAMYVNRGSSLETADRERVRAFNRMIEQIQALSRVAEDRDSSVGPREVERMHEACLDFLSLWLARLVIASRESSADLRDIRRKLDQIDRDLATADRATAAQLRRAQAEYQGVINRRQALVGKTVAIDAALTAMPDKIEEIYQMVIASPYSKGMGGRLEDSLSRLRLAEELEQELSFDLSDTLPSGVAFDHASTASAVPSAGKERARTSARQSTLN